MQAWSTKTLKEHGHATGVDRHYSIQEAGVWVDCLKARKPVIYNDYAVLQHKRGMPEGHAEVKRFIQVPIYRGNLAVAIIGVGNKQSDYTEEDAEVLAGLADLTWDIASRKLAEEQVRKDEAFSQAVLNSLKAHIAVLDRDGNIVAVNKAWKEFAKANNGEELLVGNYLEACLKASQASNPYAARALDGIRSVMNGASPSFELEYPCSSPEEERWFHMTVYPMALEEGGAVVAHEDVSARHQAEAKTRDALKRYQSLFELFPAGIVIADERGRIRQSNPIARQLLGLTEEQLLGRRIDEKEWEVVRPDGTPMPKVEFASVRAMKEGWPVSNVGMGVRCPDGNTRWLNVSATPFPSMESGVAIVYTDVTDKRRIESELIASAKRFSSVFHHNPVAIALSNLKTHEIVDVNEAWVQLTGYDRHEAIGRTALDLSLWVDPRKRTLLVREVRSKESVKDFEIKVLRKNGQVIDVALFAEAIEVNGDRCLLAMGLDITNRKRAEAMLVDSRARLERLVSERTAALKAFDLEHEEVNYAISHNLRGPLRAINGFSRILLADHAAGMDEEAKDLLNRVCFAADRMSVLVDAMLQLSRISRAEMVQREVDLATLFQASIRRLAESDPSRQVRLHVSEGMSVLGDPDLLRTLIDILAENAWNATSRQRLARTTFSCIRQRRRAVFCVKDNGLGFDTQYANKLFEPFQKIHSFDEFPGVGIGLALATRIVQRHKGEMWATGKPGKGAAFYFTFGLGI